jgi:hypothetical protein
MGARNLGILLAAAATGACIALGFVKLAPKSGSRTAYRSDKCPKGARAPCGDCMCACALWCDGWGCQALHHTAPQSRFVVVA